jgi:chemotaxis protein CheX
MKAEYVNSFYKATKDVFQLMIDTDPKRSDLRAVENIESSRYANVLLRVIGDLEGTILFSFPKDTALEMVKIMSGMDMDKIDSFASSALGEVANIIGGNALTSLAESSCICDIKTPEIFLGGFNSLTLVNEKALLLTLAAPIGEFDITISLKEKRSLDGAAS